jgi:uncharacterized membrane protein
MTLERRRSPPWAPFLARPRLTGALAAGLAAYLLSSLIPNPLSWSTRAILAWDLTCVVFIVAGLMGMRGGTEASIAARAASQDEGRHMILALVLVCAAASLGAIALELSVAKGAHGWEKAARIVLAFFTVAVSWFVVQMVFAFHYAHQYYSRGEGRRGRRGGLGFPGDEPPDYWDFLHFAVVIGVASQTADVTFTSKPLRRLGTVQSVVAFAFNTVVLALTINLLAPLF